MNMTLQRKPCWWKEPMVWLIIALPLAAVIASIVTVFIASRSADTLVQGDYQKEGLALLQVTERDQRAAQLGLSAQIRLRDGRVWVELSGQLDAAPEYLMMLLAHPTQAEKDLALSLSHQGGTHYAGVVPDLRGVNWQVQLEPADQSWRLAGRWHAIAGDTLRLAAPQSASSTRP